MSSHGESCTAVGDHSIDDGCYRHLSIPPPIAAADESGIPVWCSAMKRRFAAIATALALAAVGPLVILTSTTEAEGVQSGQGGFYVMTHAERVFDTRLSGPPVQPNRTFEIDLPASLPDDVNAAVVNLTVVGRSPGGWATAHTYNNESWRRYATSNVNWNYKGETESNQVTVATNCNPPLLDPQRECFFVSLVGSADVIVDLVAYYRAEHPDSTTTTVELLPASPH